MLLPSLWHTVSKVSGLWIDFLLLFFIMFLSPVSLFGVLIAGRGFFFNSPTPSLSSPLLQYLLVAPALLSP